MAIIQFTYCPLYSCRVGPSLAQISPMHHSVCFGALGTRSLTIFSSSIEAPAARSISSFFWRKHWFNRSLEGLWTDSSSDLLQTAEILIGRRRDPFFGRFSPRRALAMELILSDVDVDLAARQNNNTFRVRAREKTHAARCDERTRTAPRACYVKVSDDEKAPLCSALLVPLHHQLYNHTSGSLKRFTQPLSAYLMWDFWTSSRTWAFRSK